jgi:hypothetical protein
VAEFGVQDTVYVELNSYGAAYARGALLQVSKFLRLFGPNLEDKAMILAIRAPILRLPSGSVFEFTMDGKTMGRPMVVYSEYGDYSCFQINGPFFAAFPFAKNNPYHRLDLFTGSESATTSEIQATLRTFRSIMNGHIPGIDSE